MPLKLTPCGARHVKEMHSKYMFNLVLTLKIVISLWMDISSRIPDQLCHIQCLICACVASRVHKHSRPMAMSSWPVIRWPLSYNDIVRVCVVEKITREGLVLNKVFMVWLLEFWSLSYYLASSIYARVTQRYIEQHACATTLMNTSHESPTRVSTSNTLRDSHLHICTCGTMHHAHVNTLCKCTTWQKHFVSFPMARLCLRSRRRVPNACSVYERCMLNRLILKLK